MMTLLNPGEFVTCENGHLIGEIVRPLELGDSGWGDVVGHWRIEQPPRAGVTPLPLLCPQCGAPYCSTDPALHIEGRGWVR